MTLSEESQRSLAGTWQRRVFYSPPGASWLPEVLDKLHGAATVPGLRGLRRERDGNLTIEEFLSPGLLPLAAYLTKSAAPLWVFVSIVQQCLAGLTGLHGCGLMHGAISTETLLINAEGNVILTNMGGGFCPPEWKGGGKVAGALSQPLAARDLSDLGRVFRAVLGGDADTKMTASRPDIAPMVSDWIDWLASPEAGREPLSATQAEMVFADIRAGRAGLRPWQNKSELPPEVEFGSTKQLVPMTEEERRKLRRAAARAHGSGIELKGQFLIFALIAILLAGGILVVNHFFADQKNTASDQKKLALPGGGVGLTLHLADESGDLFAASGGDVEPLADTGETIENLNEIVAHDMKPGELWQKALQRRQKGSEGAAGNGLGGGGAPDSFLYDPLIFPAMGRATAGVEPGDYYLVWRTRGLVLTPEESRTMQAAVLRSTRYCGVRLLAWTVLPNQVAVILRVLPRHPLPDEKLERRIAILRGDKTAAAVIAQVNAKLKAGDDAGAEQVRRKWTASMGSAAGFLSVIKTVVVVEPAVLAGRPLWQDKPLHFSLLNPDTPDVLQAAAIVDAAAAKGKLVEVVSEWRLCGLRAALHNYAPSLRAISVLMQKNPQASLPLPTKEEILKSLVDYRRYVGDLPPEPVSPTPPADGGPAVVTPVPEPPKSTKEPSPGNK